MSDTLQTTPRSLVELLAMRHVGNPKEHDLDGIAESIKRWGFNDPVTFDSTSNVIVEGHGRLAALLRLKTAGAETPKRVTATVEGDWLVPVLEVAFADEEERDAYLVAHNRLNESGGTNEAKLAALLAKFKRPNLASMGFTRDAYDSLLAKFKAPADTLSQEELERVDTGARIYEVDDIAEAAFHHYRAAGFPYPDPPAWECIQEINRLASMPTGALVNTRIGYAIADKFQRHRFAASAEKMRSPLDAFLDDDLLRRAIDLIMRYEGSLTPGALRGTVSMVKGTQGCANFRPGFAAFIYRKFCPVGGTVLDTSTGYGGRLVGAIASTVVRRYVGIDPNPTTCEGNRKLLAMLRREHFAHLIELPAEDVDANTTILVEKTGDVPRETNRLADLCDFAFTSPPYFRKEHYSDDETQSWKRYPEPDRWREGFLIPMLRLTFSSLKRDRYAAVNIADVVLDGDRHPLGQWTCEAAQLAGFRVVDRLDFPMTRRFGANQQEGVATEPVYVFRKD